MRRRRLSGSTGLLAPVQYRMGKRQKNGRPWLVTVITSGLQNAVSSKGVRALQYCTVQYCGESEGIRVAPDSC